jgi:hypothetical protein
MQADPGAIRFIVGPERGPITVEVSMPPSVPEIDESYEDIAEISLSVPRGRVSLLTWVSSYPLPSFPPGPGTYRVRYSVIGMNLMYAPTPVEKYLIQLWPAPLADPRILKITSMHGRYLASPAGWE